MMKVPEQFRVKKGVMASDESFGNNGYFVIPHESYDLNIIASDGQGWEHVSVSMPLRTPNWKQMCFIKEMFWEGTDCVVQYHPPESDYVNNHEHCLHLWRSLDVDMPRPGSILVGYK